MAYASFGSVFNIQKQKVMMKVFAVSIIRYVYTCSRYYLPWRNFRGHIQSFKSATKLHQFILANAVFNIEAKTTAVKTSIDLSIGFIMKCYVSDLGLGEECFSDIVDWCNSSFCDIDSRCSK